MENNVSRRVLTPEEKAIRAKKLKRKRNFRLAIVICGFFLALSIVISPILILTAFRIKSFTVEGVSPYTDEEIIAASGMELGDSLAFANLDKAGESIEKILPYTDNVKLTKKLPDKIIIRFDETSRAFAIEVSSGMYALTDINLKVLELSGVLPEGVALVTGITPMKTEVGEEISFVTDGESDISVELIRRIAAAITENSVEGIDYIDITNRSDIRMIYGGRIVLRLGDSIDVESKISLGNKVIKEENAIDPSQYGTVDLTIPKKAYFNPSDYEDIEILVEYNETYVREDAVQEEITEEATSEEDSQEE